ncbi:hypothetical protein YC2023_094612 [Brassica napus]
MHGDVSLSDVPVLETFLKRRKIHCCSGCYGGGGGGSGRYSGDRLGGSDNRYSGCSDRSSSYRGFGSRGSIVSSGFSSGRSQSSGKSSFVGSPFPKTFKQLERDLSENLRRLGHLSCHAQ